MNASAGARCVGAAASLTAIEPRGPHEQDEHGERVDEKSASLGIKIFPANIENAKQHGGKQRAFEAAEPTDRDDNKKEYQIDQGEAWREPEGLNRKAATQRGQSAP